VGTQGPILLRVDNVSVRYGQGSSLPYAVWQTSLVIHEGECIGLLGESGCGKTTLARALIGLLPNGAVVDGSIVFRGQEITSTPAIKLRGFRGAQIALIAQDPAQALNPVLTIGPQITEVLRSHSSLSRRNAGGGQ
jgi:ABC-type glutathione transport system ATPase component